MHHPNMLLWRANVACVLKGNPWVTGFKKHSQHLAPQASCLNFFEKLNFTACCLGFIFQIGTLKLGTKFIMQIGAG